MILTCISYLLTSMVMQVLYTKYCNVYSYSFSLLVKVSVLLLSCGMFIQADYIDGHGIIGIIDASIACSASIALWLCVHFPALCPLHCWIWTNSDCFPANDHNFFVCIVWIHNIYLIWLGWKCAIGNSSIILLQNCNSVVWEI